MTRNRTDDLLSVAMLALVVAAATAVAPAQTYTDLYNFDGTHGADPTVPQVLAQGRDGNLYGTTGVGGTHDLGVVFKITPSGTQNVLFNFDGTHGATSSSGLTLGTDGNFYGATTAGGVNNLGTVFKITAAGHLTLLHSFTDRAPIAPPIQANNGSFYGTTFFGTSYKITSSGTFTALGSVTGTPYAPLLQATDGNLYGTENGGGIGFGAVFKLTPAGIVTNIYSFDNTHGRAPEAPVIQGSDGNFYGSTNIGGNGEGVVFRLTPRGAIRLLHNFPDPNFPNDGGNPVSGIIQATDGNFYGATAGGGTVSGVIFKITPAGDYSILYDFDNINGGSPESVLVQHTNGKIYGLAHSGASNQGVVYSFDLGLAPFVRTLPTSGKVGNAIGILGGGLTGTTSVQFNGKSASFTVVSDTFISTSVPDGASTGLVKVVTPGGTLTSSQTFRVTPAIKTFNPTSGKVGIPVTITGTSFTGTTKVTFGGVKATTFTVNSDTQVTANVPTGAKTGKIAITTPGGTATGPGVFTVTQ